MSKINIKKPLVNDGGHNAFGVDVDPKKELTHVTNKDGTQSTYYKGTKMKYDDYVTCLEERYHDKNKIRSMGSFSGFGKGTMKKNYE